MKQIKPGNQNSAGAALRLGQEIALEFARIAKLSENGKEEEAWGAANTLHAKHPNDGTSNFIIALMLANKEKKPEALVYAKRAVKLAPDNAIFKV